MPLTGLTIVELGSSVAGPFAAETLADLGARVVKVERPGAGDDARGWGPPFWHGPSAPFQHLNRNKASVAVDFKDPEALAALKAFIAREADVVVQNMRPGAADRLGLGAEALTADNPRLIYCTIGAFGNRGPLKHHAGYDPLMQAFGGIMSVTGEAGRPPVRVGASIVDLGAGMWGAIGILAALHRRNVTGRGGTVDTSLFETALGWMGILMSAYRASGELPKPQGTGLQMLVPYQGFETRTGWLIVAAGNDRQFARLARALGRPEWADDPRFMTNAARVAHREELIPAMAVILAAEPRGRWVEALDAADVPCAPMQNMAEVLAHPQTAAMGQIQPVPGTDMELVGLPVSIDGVRPPIRSRAPEVGQDTETLLPAAKKRRG